MPSPFMVTTLSANYSYDEDTGNTTISDARLLNKRNYPVSTDQTGGGDFHLSQLIYNEVDPDDDTKGNVVITGFELDPDAHITIIVPGDRDASADTTYAGLLADVALLKLICGPMLTTPAGANGARIWWTGALADIPAGYEIDADWAGVVPVALNPDDDDFKVMGDTGGSKTVTLTLENIPPHTHDLITPSRDLANYADAGPDITKNGAGDTRTFTTEKTGGYDPGTGTNIARPYSNMNPYKIGCWIKFIGIA